MAEKKQAKSPDKKSQAVEKITTQQGVAVAKFTPPALMPPSIRDLMELGTALAKSRMFPNINTSEAAVAVIEYGRELNIPPVVACQTIYLVKGRLGMMAQLMQALLERDGVIITILEKTRERCRLKFEKKGKDPFEEEFTAGDATRMNLANKDNYQKTPEEMYYCRCLTKGGRVYHPSSWLGLYSVVELQDDYIPDVTPEEEETITEIIPESPRETTGKVEKPKPKPKPQPKPEPKQEEEEPPLIGDPIAKDPEAKDPETPENEQPEEEKEQPTLTEEPTAEAEQVTMATDDQKKDILDKMKLLQDEYNRDEEDLRKSMAVHLKKGFGTVIQPVNIPGDCDYKEAKNLIVSLDITIEHMKGEKL